MTCMTVVDDAENALQYDGGTYPLCAQNFVEIIFRESGIQRISKKILSFSFMTQ
jgi:hypothetical protein